MDPLALSTFIPLSDEKGMPVRDFEIVGFCGLPDKLCLSDLPVSAFASDQLVADIEELGLDPAAAFDVEGVLGRAAQLLCAGV